MGAKKKTAAGKTKKGKSSKSNEDSVKIATSTNVSIDNNFLLNEKWVALDFKLLHWNFMDEKVLFRDSTKIFTIKKQLQEKHGISSDLRICFYAFNEQNEIKNELQTISQCGIEGKIPCMKLDPITNQSIIDESSIPVIPVLYDFTTKGDDNPVLLHFRRI